MRAFNLRASLRLSLTVNRPIHLDGLLLAARERRENVLDLDRPLECVAMDRGVYRASAGLLVAPGLQGAAVQPIYRTWRFRLGDRMGIAPFAVNEETPRPERVLPPSNSKYLNGFRRQDLLTGIESIVWQCVGDPDAVLTLAREIHAVGASAQTGYGRVREWTVEPCDASDAEAGWFSGNRVLRNLPESHVPAGMTVDPTSAVPGLMRAVPPYWDVSERVPCWAPTLQSLILDGDAADAVLKAA